MAAGICGKKTQSTGKPAHTISRLHRVQHDLRGAVQFELLHQFGAVGLHGRDAGVEQRCHFRVRQPRGQILVPGLNGKLDRDLVAPLPQARIAPAPGPAGWAAAVTEAWQSLRRCEAACAAGVTRRVIDGHVELMDIERIHYHLYYRIVGSPPSPLKSLRSGARAVEVDLQYSRGIKVGVKIERGKRRWRGALYGSGMDNSRQPYAPFGLRFLDAEAPLRHVPFADYTRVRALSLAA